MDLTARRESDSELSNTDIKKHRNDIVRLSQLIAPSERIALPSAIHDDLARFVASALMDGAEPGVFGVVGMTLEDVRDLLETVYERAQ